jgi:hypothetical protein
MVVLGAGVAESAATGYNLCSDYCGYHGSGFTAQIQKFYYGVVGFSTLPLRQPLIRFCMSWPSCDQS